MTIKPQKILRSYSCRSGRITKAQQQALDQLLPHFSLDSHMAHITSFIGHAKHCYLEIGFGNGAALIELAEQNPDAFFIGVEVHRPGVGHILMQIHENEIDNLLVFHGDSHAFFSLITNKLFFDGVFVWFPDPWPKKKHHKRRLVNHYFIEQIKQIMKKDAYLHLATDWYGYAQCMQSTLQDHSEFNLLPAQTIAHFLMRPQTKYEQRGLRLGHKINDLVYQFTPPQQPNNTESYSAS